jgi:hypothetical protein
MGRTKLERSAEIVAAFNRQLPIGTPVRFWRGLREGPGQFSKTRSVAILLSGHTPVVWLAGTSGAIALTHVQPIATRPRKPAD